MNARMKSRLPNPLYEESPLPLTSLSQFNLNAAQGQATLNKYRFGVDTIKGTNIVVVRLIGAMPSTLFVDRLFDFYRKIGKPWLYKRLFDFRKFDGFIDYSDIEHLARKWAYLTRNESYSSKVAFVSHTVLDRVRVSTIAPLFPSDILRAFPAIDLALDWLNEQQSLTSGID